MPNELLGRSAERAAGRRFLDAVGRGPTCLAIAGEPGIGKSALWRTVVDQASALGHRVLVSRPSELEADLAHASLTDLLLPVADEVRPHLPPPQRRALDVALLAADPDEGAGDLRALGMAVATALRILATRTPVVVAIDDLQWADAASVRALGFAARRLGGERLGLLVTRRSGPVPALAAEVERAFAGEGLEILALGPMSLGALHQLIETRFAISLPRPSLVHLERASRGIPLMALDIVDALRHAGQELTPEAIVPPPVEVDRMVAHRMDRIPAAAQSVVVAVAALGRARLDVLQAVVATRDVRADLGPAIQEGILEQDGDRVRFVHPLYRSAVYGAEPRDRLQDLHRRIAGVLSDHEEAALHLALAAAMPDAEVARTVAECAVDAQRRGALDSAAVLYEHALRLTPADATAARVDRKLALGRILWELGDIARSRLLTTEVLRDASRGSARAMALVLQAMHLLWSEGPAAAIPVYLEALALVSNDPVLEATIHLRIAYVADEDLALAATHAAAAADLLTGKHEANDLRACALLMKVELDIMRGHPHDPVAAEQGRAMLSFAQQPVDPRVPFDARAVARERSWLLRAATDDLVAARAELEEIRRDDADRGFNRGAPITYLDLTELSCQLGDVSAAQGYVGQAMEFTSQTGRLPYAEASARLATALFAEHTGDLVQAADAGRDAYRLASGLGPTPLLDRATVLLARIDLAEDRPAEAADLLMTLDARLDRTGMREPGAYRFRGDLVESLVAAGRIDESAAQAARFAAAVDAAPTPWGQAVAARSHALVAAASGDLDAAILYLHAALTHHIELPMPIERGRTLLHLGRAMRRRRRKRTAAEALGAALVVFEAAGAVQWASQARRELDRVGVRPTTADELTATEREVARLAAGGMTNRQVADVMILSPKSVDGVLTRVYAKLDIHSRAELGAWIARESTQA